MAATVEAQPVQHRAHLLLDFLLLIRSQLLLKRPAFAVNLMQARGLAARNVRILLEVLVHLGEVLDHHSAVVLPGQGPRHWGSRLAWGPRRGERGRQLAGNGYGSVRSTRAACEHPTTLAVPRAARASIWAIQGASAYQLASTADDALFPSPVCVMTSNNLRRSRLPEVRSSTVLDEIRAAEIGGDNFSVLARGC